MTDKLLSLFGWCAVILVAWFVLLLLTGFLARAYGAVRRYRERQDPTLGVARVERERDLVRRNAELAHRNRLVGDLYAVVSKGDQKLQLWLSEHPTGWDLREKFGWFQHKLARPLPSASHDVTLLREDVVLDRQLHQHLPPSSPSPEERRLRIAKHDAELPSGEALSLFIIHNRLDRRVETHLVADTDVEEFQSRNPDNEFVRVHLAAKGAWLRHSDAVRGTKVFVSDAQIHADAIERVEAEHDRSSAHAKATIALNAVLVALPRPSGYEDVPAELVAVDALDQQSPWPHEVVRDDGAEVVIALQRPEGYDLVAPAELAKEAINALWPTWRTIQS